MRFVRVSVLVLAVTLAGCAYQPIVSHEGIERLHSVKVVYIQPSYILAIYQYESSSLMPMLVGGGRTIFVPVPGAMPSGDYLTDDYLASRYQDEINTLDVRPQFLAAATQAISQVSWLAQVPLTVIDHPMDMDAMRHYVLDSNVDAVVYLVPIEGLYPNGHSFRVGIEATLYVNPRTRNSFNYVSTMIPDDQEVQLKRDPGKPYRSPSARSPKQLADVWFADDAAQLHDDIELALAQIEPGIVHFLDGDMPAKRN